jgi:hypothetical protein
MAGNLLQVSSTTHGVRVKTNGIVVAGASDPCCCDSLTCCAAASSTSVARVTFSGMTVCCYRSGVTCTTFGVDPNGTYDLPYYDTYTVGPVTYCRWYLPECLTITTHSCPTVEDCTGAVTSTSLHGIILTTGSDGTSALAGVAPTLANTASFLHSLAAGSLCSTGEQTFTNEFTTCTALSVAYGGTADVIFV